MLFSLGFANISLWSYFLFSFLIFDLYFLIPAVIAEHFSPIILVDLAILIGIPSKEAKAEIEMYQVIEEAKIRKSFT